MWNTLQQHLPNIVLSAILVMVLWLGAQIVIELLVDPKLKTMIRRGRAIVLTVVIVIYGIMMFQTLNT